MKRTPIYKWHKENSGTLINFEGWELPVYYSQGSIKEHHLVRNSVGLFDTCHMGRFEITGKDAKAFLDHVLTKNIDKISDFGSGYSLICNEDGGILDDLFVYNLSSKWITVVNASNTNKDYSWFKKQILKYDAVIKDITADTGMIAVQGPNAINLLNSLFDIDIWKIKRFHVLKTNFNSYELLICRTGYTGEEGVEIIISSQSVKQLWEDIIKHGNDLDFEAGPAGLAARDSLRFEAGFPLYGHELNENIQPTQAKLKWACDFKKDFIGKNAIIKNMKEGYEQKLTTFAMLEKAVPRENFIVYNEKDDKIGHVASGMYAPTIEKFCGNAYVKEEYAAKDKVFYIGIRNKKYKAETVKSPLYIPVYRKKR